MIKTPPVKNLPLLLTVHNVNVSKKKKSAPDHSHQPAAGMSTHMSPLNVRERYLFALERDLDQSVHSPAAADRAGSTSSYAEG